MRPNISCPKSPAPGAMRRWLFLALPIVPALVMGQITPAPKALSTGKTILYAAVGAEITQYDFDGKNTTLIRRSSVTLPANVQEAWLQPNDRILYVAWSNGGASYSTPPKNDHHGITAFRIDPQSGALQIHGQPASLPSRPIFTTIDIDGGHIITAHNEPSSLTVHRLLPDGSPGARIQQAATLDFGNYGHQVRVDP